MCPLYFLERGIMRKFLIGLLVIIVIVGGVGIWFVNNLDNAKDPDSTEEISIEIPEGTYASEIGKILEKNGIINSALNFKVYLKLTKYDGQMKAGNYTLSPSMDFKTIVTKLEENETNDMMVTVPEGLTIEQTARKLADQGAGKYKKFMKAIKKGDFDYSWLKGDSLEGYLMPDTYSIPKGTSEHDIIDMMLDNFEDHMVKAYEKSKSSIKDDYSLDEILTTASIIERECAVNEERPLVASVIYNRMNNNMMLQMCSTVQYILLRDTGETKALLYNDDIAIDDPYNTYIHYGLPPGPICSPGLKSFKAALKPDKSDYLFFVLSADLDGTSRFTSDYNQFLKDKDEYYEAYNAAHSK